MVNTRRPKRSAGAPSRDPMPVKPASKAPPKPVSKPSEDKSVGKKVRVWWAPTKDRKRSGYSGMYWPATYVKKGTSSTIHVKYDNGEAEEVDVEAVAPAHVPMAFGGESSRLEVGEFCEVFNNSATDPAAWVGRVAKVNKKTYQVEYPFHDAEAELIKEELIRRARVWEESEKSWKFVKPYQTWPDGEVTNPWELELVTEKELKRVLKDGPSVPSAPTSPSAPSRKETPKKAPTPPPSLPSEPAPPPAAAVAPTTAAPAAAPAAAAPDVKPPAKRGRPRKTEEQKAEDAAKKRARKAEEEAMAAVLAAAPPAVPQVPAVQGMGMMAGGNPNAQALQGLLSAPNLLPLLQGLMAVQNARPSMPAAAPAAMGISMPMAPLQPAAPVAPKPVPTPPEAIHIPPLPPPLEEEEEPLVVEEIGEEEEEREAEEGKKKKRKKKAGPLIQVPKKARSAYILFSMDFRKNVPANTDFNEATRQAAALWKDADEATRKKFEELANVEREEHAKKQGEYLEKKKVLDAKLAARIARQQAHAAAVKAHEEAKMKQLELNAAYHRACGLAGVVPQPVPQVPGASSMYLEASTSASEEDAVATQINKLDMEKARKHILKYYHEDAFYLLVDTWRRDSPKLNDALSSAKCHVFSKLRADWKAFMIGTFGKDVMNSMLRKEGDAPPAPEEA